MKDIVIYGAGRMGRILLEMVQPIFYVRYFVDSDEEKQGQYIETKLVLSPDVLQNEKNVDVVLSIQSEQVEKYLTEQNINYYKNKNFFCRSDVKKKRDEYLLDRFLNNFQELNALFYEETSDWYRKKYCSRENEVFANKLLSNENNEENNYNNFQLYYDEYLENRADMRLILNLIHKNNRAKSICDVGCGYGELIKKLHSEKFKVLGIDGSQVKIESLKDIGIDAEQHDIENMIWKREKFDVVTCLHVLEHVKSVNKVVEAIYKILSDKGQVYVSVPYQGFIDDVTHVRQFTINKLANLFTNQGFKVINIQTLPYLNYEANNTILLHAQKIK